MTGHASDTRYETKSYSLARLASPFNVEVGGAFCERDLWCHCSGIHTENTIWKRCRFWWGYKNVFEIGSCVTFRRKLRKVEPSYLPTFPTKLNFIMRRVPSEVEHCSVSAKLYEVAKWDTIPGEFRGSLPSIDMRFASLPLLAAVHHCLMSNGSDHSFL